MLKSLEIIMNNLDSYIHRDYSNKYRINQIWEKIKKIRKETKTLN
jgi:hypothetical protein